MKKIKIHIRNNHWKEGFLPCDAEGEKNNTITKEEIEKGFDQYPELRDKVEYLIDWDDDNFISSMQSADCIDEIKLSSSQSIKYSTLSLNSGY